ncbi:hypothetical protein RIF29_20199 [Crotalaria pallida]|uniref:Aminotransferase-like plant mobile domain-containing protein n=1 Tax=Crotalaria pallida TaxID=3830 RepID=A0AAN9F525_CROPI
MTMLICVDKTERHLSNRCSRQYGMLQSISDDVEHWERKSRGVDDEVTSSDLNLVVTLLKMHMDIKLQLDQVGMIAKFCDTDFYISRLLTIIGFFLVRTYKIRLSAHHQRTSSTGCPTQDCAKASILL